jgi:hypothetical protein
MFMLFVEYNTGCLFEKKCQKVCPEENSFESCMEKKHSQGPIKLFQCPRSLDSSLTSKNSKS